MFLYVFLDSELDKSVEKADHDAFVKNDSYYQSERVSEGNAKHQPKDNNCRYKYQ